MTPGIYRDAVGDLWTCDGETLVHIAAHSPSGGPMWPVRDHPGISIERMAMGDWDDKVLPFEWVDEGDVPPEVVLS